MVDVPGWAEWVATAAVAGTIVTVLTVLSAWRARRRDRLRRNATEATHRLWRPQRAGGTYRSTWAGLDRKPARHRRAEVPNGGPAFRATRRGNVRI